MTHKIRVAVIGTSWWAEGAHLPAIQAHPNLELVALCGRNAMRLAEMAAKFGAPSTYTDYGQMLAEAKPEAVIILTPNFQHKAMTLAALEAGANVICEKPLALNAAEAGEMLAHAGRLQRRHLTFLTYRAMPGPRFIKQLIEQGYLGQLHHAQVAYLHESWLNPNRAANWKTVKATGGSGVLHDLGPHMLDMLQWWLGPVARAAGSLQTFIHERPKPDGTRALVETDDAAACTLEFAAGGQATVQLSRVAPGRHNYQRVELYGSRGVLVYEYEQALAHVGRISGAAAHSGEVQNIPIPAEMVAGFAGQDTFPAVFAELTRGFFESVRTGGPSPAPSFVEGLAVQKVIDAVLRSAENGRWEAV